MEFWDRILSFTAVRTYFHVFYVYWCYVGENDVCDVFELISPPGKLKNMPDHGGNRTYDLWNTSPNNDYS